MEQNNNCCVYIHRNTINNKAYIGISIYGDNPNKRWQNGKGYSKQPNFYNAILKYGWGNFEHIVWAKGLSLESAQRMEILLIALFNTTNHDFGYNVSGGGDWSFADEVETTKRTISALEAKNQKRIQRSIELFKDRFDNGDENILQCQKCGAYFEKNKEDFTNNNKRSAGKTERRRMKRKYCDYCATYHKRPKRIVICVDCEKKFVVTNRNIATYRCSECQSKAVKENNRKNVERRKAKVEITKMMSTIQN